MTALSFNLETPSICSKSKEGLAPLQHVGALVDSTWLGTEYSTLHALSWEKRKRNTIEIDLAEESVKEGWVKYPRRNMHTL